MLYYVVLLLIFASLNSALVVSKSKSLNQLDETVMNQDKEEECYQTKCSTNLFKVMRAVSKRPEKLIYCKPNCDCCIKNNLNKLEELQLYHQLMKEDMRFNY